MSQWPEPTPEPGETPRWLGWGVGACLIGALALLAPGDDDWMAEIGRSWRMPDISLPEMGMPDIDLRGRSEPTRDPGPIGELAAISEIAGEPGEPLVRQNVGFEACAGTIAETAGVVGQEPSLIEDEGERRVAVFKFLSGDLTITCADGAMTVLQRN